MKTNHINEIKQKVKLINQLNKETLGITDKQLKVNNFNALNKRINERLMEIITGEETI